MIQFTHVTKIIDNKYTVLDDVSFLIQRGEFVFLTGPSGAGKTTIIKHIYMGELPTRGQIFVYGFNSHEITPEQMPFLRRRLGVVFQSFKLMFDRTVFENIAVVMRITGLRERAIRKKVFQVLAEVGLSHKVFEFPERLSGGEQQRLAIARAIANDPYVLLTDEPTGNLDEETGKEIINLLRRINAAGTAIIMATHDTHLIEKMPYRTLRIDRGRMMTRE
jgi:cell division transport system ATP-binding protein